MIRPLELSDMESIRAWRNKCLPYLRTPFALTMEMQEDWYKNEICNRNSKTRFWAIEVAGRLVGYGGIENIQWENSIGEISLLINPEYQGRGIGHGAAIDILYQAFNVLNLNTVFGEVYHNNPAVKFWKLLTNQYDGATSILYNRKYWDGNYYDATYFSIQRDGQHE